MDSTFSFVMLMRLVRRVISLSHCLLLTDNGSGEGDSWVGRVMGVVMSVLRILNLNQCWVGIRRQLGRVTNLSDLE